MKNNILFILLILVLPSCHKPTNNLPIDQDPITVYSHGYLCNKWIAHVFRHSSLEHPNKLCPNAFIIGPMKSFNYSDYLNPTATHLGQDGDIKRLHNICQKYEKVILVGTSRGASAIINYLGTYKPTNVIAAVVESPFDHFDNIAEQVITHNRLFNRICTRYNKAYIKKKVFRMFFRNYKENGMQPLYTAPQIPKEIPILIISSDQDTLIPAWSTKNVYDALRESGHEKTYLLACEYGRHGRIAWGKDGARMKNVVHAFYKYHDVPHHEPWAQEGANDFMGIIF